MQQPYDQLCQTSELSAERLKFPGGILKKNKMVLEDYHRLALSKLQANEMGGLNFEPMNSQKTLWSLRWNGKGRILGMISPNPISKKLAFFVVALYPNHELQKIKCLNVKELHHQIIDLSDPSRETQELNRTIKSIESNSNSWERAPYLNQQFIVFNTQQDQVIKVQLPVIVTGAAGSGKTLIVIQRLFNFLLEYPNLTALYCAPTSALVKEAQSLFSDLVTQYAEQLPPKQAQKLIESQKHIEFQTIESVVLRNKNQEQWIDKSHLTAWLEKKQKEHPLLRTEFSRELILQEFCIIASLKSPDHYLNLGEMQTTVEDKSERKLCLDWYQNYVSAYREYTQLLFPIFKKDRKEYDLVVVDEIQKNTLKQLQELIKCARKNQIFFCGDPLQGSDYIPVISGLRQLLICDYKVKEPIVQLCTTFRNPEPVIYFANELLKMRRQFGGGIVERWETIQMKPPEHTDEQAYPVEWIDSLEGDSKIQELTDLLQKPNVMLITGSEESATRAKNLFKDPFILLSDQAQGLEAEVVFVYCPFSMDMMKEMSRKLSTTELGKDNHHFAKKNQRNYQFTVFINGLFTAITRVAQSRGRLIIYLGERNHSCARLFDELKERIQPKVSKPQAKSNTSKAIAKPMPPEPQRAQPDDSPLRSKEQWIMWIRRIYKKDEERAKQEFLKHVSPSEDEFRLYFPVPKEKVQNIRTTDPTINTENIPANSNTTKKQAVTKLVFDETDIFFDKIINDEKASLLKLFLSRNDGGVFLHKTYRQQNGETNKTLFQSILSHENRILDLLKIIKTNPFCLKFFVDTGKISLASILQSLDNTSNTVPIMKLLFSIINQFPDFIDNLSINSLKHFINILYKNKSDELQQIGLEILYRVILKSPSLFHRLFLNKNYKLEEPELTLLVKRLLKTQLGCTILITLWQAFPDLLSEIDLNGLSQYTNDLDDDGIPLFFWITTNDMNQALFFELIKCYPDIPRSFNKETLLHKVTSPDRFINGTNIIFWLLMLHRAEILDHIVQNNKLFTTDEITQYVNSQSYPHPQFEKLSIEGQALMQFARTSPHLEAPSGFIPVMSIVHLPGMTLGRFARFNSEQKTLINAVREATSENDFIEKLNYLLNHPNAESMLFDYPYPYDGSNQLLIAIMKRGDLYEYFLSIIQENPKFAALFSIDRLNEVVEERSNEMSSLLDVSLSVCSNKNLLFILIKLRPELIDLIHSKEMLFNPSFCSFNKSHFLSVQNILTVLCSFDQTECLRTLIKPKNITPQFINALMFFRFYKNNLDLICNFGLLSSELGKTWLVQEPRMMDYFTYEMLFPTHDTKKPLVAKSASAEEDDDDNEAAVVGASNPQACYETYNVLQYILTNRQDIAKRVKLSQLPSSKKNLNSFFHYLSTTIEGIELLKQLLSYDLFSQTNPEFLYEMSQEPYTNDTTLDKLLATDSGVSLVLDLMKSPSFLRQFDYKQLINFESFKHYERLLKLIKNFEGLAIIDFILAQYPLAFEKMPYNFLYKKIALNPSLLVELGQSKADFSFILSLIYFILETNPNLVRLEAQDFVTFNKIEIILKALYIQLEEQWLDDSTRAVILDLINYLNPVLSPNNKENSTQALAATNTKFLSLCANKSLIVPLLENVLKHPDADFKLFTPFYNSNTQITEPLFNALIKNNDCIIALNDMYENNSFLATGAILKSVHPLHALMKHLADSPSPHTNIIRLIAKIINNQPDIVSNLSSEYITEEFLNKMCKELQGQVALYDMIKFAPRLFIEAFPRLTKTTGSSASWMLRLFDTPMGCEFLINLDHHTSGKCWDCLESSALIERLNEPLAIPFLFYIATTRQGRRLLDLILKKFPALQNALTESNLTIIVASDDPEYDQTDVLFWLCAEENEYGLLKELKRNGVLSPDVLNRRLKHVFSVGDGSKQLTVQHFIDQNSANITPAKPLFPLLVPQNYLNSNCGFYNDFSIEDQKLIDSVESSIGNVKQCSINLKRILDKSNAGALIFDYQYKNKRTLFHTLVYSPPILEEFHKLLEKYPKYYQIFTIDVLFQAFWKGPNMITPLFYFLKSKNFLGSLLKNNKAFKAEMMPGMLLQTIYKTEDTEIYALGLLCEHFLGQQALEEFNSDQLLQPMIVTNLFQLRTGFRSELTLFAYDFLMLCFLNSKLTISWINKKPLLLNYLSEEHLLAPYLQTRLTDSASQPLFIHCISISPAGCELLSVLFQYRPDIFDILTIKLLTDQLGDNSILSNLCSNPMGIKFLHSFLYRNYLLNELIRPEHLCTIFRPIPFANLIKNNGFQLLLPWMTRIDFFRTFNLQLLFEGSNPLIHLFCDKIDGFTILDCLFKYRQDAATLLTPEILFKQSCNGNDVSMLITLFNLKLPLKSLHRFVERIILNNPGLIDSTLELCEKRSPSELISDLVKANIKFLGAKKNKKMSDEFAKILQMAVAAPKTQHNRFFKPNNDSQDTKPTGKSMVIN